MGANEDDGPYIRCVNLECGSNGGSNFAEMEHSRKAFDEIEFVKDEDGKRKQFIVKMEGTSFRCVCGCNVFGKLIESRIYICNACDARYIGE